MNPEVKYEEHIINEFNNFELTISDFKLTISDFKKQINYIENLVQHIEKSTLFKLKVLESKFDKQLYIQGNTQGKIIEVQDKIILIQNEIKSEFKDDLKLIEIKFTTHKYIFIFIIMIQFAFFFGF